MVKHFLILLFCSTLLYAVPKTISYQGVLVDAAGMPKADKSYDMIFSLYNTETGGFHLWRSDRKVLVKGGIFSVTLGSETPLGDSVDFSVPYWLGIQVNSDAELSPRVSLVPTGYAIRSMVSDSSYKSGSSDVAELANSVKSGIITENSLKPGFISPEAAHAVKADTASVALNVSGASIAAGSITSAQLGNGTVTSLIIEDSTITTADLSASLVVPKAVLADAAVLADSVKFLHNMSITESKLADGAVSSLKILDGTITSSDVDSSFVAPVSVHSFKTDSAVHSKASDVAAHSLKADSAVHAQKADTLEGVIAGTQIKGPVVTDIVSAETNAGLKLLGGVNKGIIVDTSGNVGIGTATPGSKLEVAGKLKADTLEVNTIINNLTKKMHFSSSVDLDTKVEIAPGGEAGIPWPPSLRITGLPYRYVLWVNVAGNSNARQTTTVNIYRFDHWKAQPWILDENIGEWTISGRDYGDYYIDVNVSKEIPATSYHTTGLRIKNTGDKVLEIFAVGVIAEGLAYTSESAPNHSCMFIQQ